MENTALIHSMQSAWTEVRDTGSLSDLGILDQLLQRIGKDGAPGYECGIFDTFSIFDKTFSCKFSGSSPTISAASSVSSSSISSAISFWPPC